MVSNFDSEVNLLRTFNNSYSPTALSPEAQAIQNLDRAYKNKTTINKFVHMWNKQEEPHSMKKKKLHLKSSILKKPVNMSTVVSPHQLSPHQPVHSSIFALSNRKPRFADKYRQQRNQTVNMTLPSVPVSLNQSSSGINQLLTQTS